MRTRYTIKNFRVFDENGVNIELAPITILTGRNSAGKSSIVKAITLLNSYLEQIKRDKASERDIKLSKYKIEFNKVFDGLLGNFESILHRNSNDNTITFEYTIHSTMLFDDVKVSFMFIDEDAGKEGSYMHNGVLFQFCVKTMQDEVIFSSSDGQFHYNLNLIKEHFSDFALGEYYAHFYLGAFSVENKSRKEMRELEEISKDELMKIDEDTRKHILRYLRDPFSSKTPIIMDGKSYESVLSVREKGHFLHIPVIYDCLAGLNKDEVLIKLDEILNHNIHIENAEKFILDENEKYVIRRLINEILATGKSISDFWEEQEELFMGSVGEENNLSENQMMLGLFMKQSDDRVSLPNASTLSIGQSFWESYPGLWTMANEDKEQKERNIEKWKNTPLDKFMIIYEVFMRLNSAYYSWMKEKDSDYSQSYLYSYEEDAESPAGEYTHRAYRMLCEYASRAIEGLLFPEWSEKFIFIPSTRALPRRLYMPDSSNDFYAILNEYLIAKTEFENYKEHHRGNNTNDYEPNTFINYWIGEEGFDIGKSISVESVLGSAIVVKLMKNDGAEVFLTDEGYGLTQLISILICIETAILKARGVKYQNYYGQSNLDGLNTNKFYYEQQTIAIEEPEIHLHPEFQSKLADMFVSAAQYNIHFIIETHSEYLIRKSQVIVGNQNYPDEQELRTLNPFSVYYIDSRCKDEMLYELQYEITGGFKRQFGSGFFDEAADLDMEIIRKEREIKHFGF